MKNFLSKNWKRILILIAGIFIVINIVSKCVAPHTLAEEFAKYGPDVIKQQSSTSVISGESGDVSGESLGILSSISTSSLLTSEMTKILIIAIGAIIGVLLLTELISKKPSSGKKK